MTKRLFLFAAFDKFQHVDSTLMRFLNALSKLGDIAFVMDNELPDAEITAIVFSDSLKDNNTVRVIDFYKKIGITISIINV